MSKNINFKIYLKQKILLYLLFCLIVSIFCVIYSSLIYYGKVSVETESINLWTFILGIISFFALGLFSGIVAKKNGLLEGLTAGLFIILVALLINLILTVPFVSKNFVKIATYLTASSIGGILGVNIKH